MSRYGGYDTMTKENRPLIGPPGPAGSFVVGGPVRLRHDGRLRGGASGRRVGNGADVPDHADLPGLSRYDDPGLITHLEDIARRSIL